MRRFAFWQGRKSGLDFAPNIAYNSLMDIQNIKADYKALADSMGGKLFGVCHIDELRQDFHAEIRETSRELNTAISIGVPLSGSIMETLIDHPNVLYKTHYRQVNHTLNDIAFQLSSRINNLGFNAVPIPASQMITWKPMRAHLSHREVAYGAGLGWRGRDNLLVNKKYGSRVRLVTVLTDLQLPVDSPTDENCSDCYNCLDICPAGAISDDVEDFNLDACFKQVSKFARPEHIGSYICGLCLQACRGA
jgi:epoxyqueuosine reductase